MMRSNYAPQPLCAKGAPWHVGIFTIGVLLVSLGTWTGASNAEAPLGSALRPLTVPGGRNAPVAPASVQDWVRKEAQALSFAPFTPVDEINIDFADTYDEYRRLRFQPSRALWHREPPGLELQGLPLGWLFKRPIEVFAVEDGITRQVQFAAADFLDERQEAVEARIKPAHMPLSGFRISGPLNGIDKSDEIIVFQGASYFRALGRGHVYGVSARGLAVGTASNKGEEFPSFRKFWVEKPAASSTDVVVHALMDSPSVTGAYSFFVRPGTETVVDVTATLYPRQALAEVGIAPLTSMFLVGPVNAARARDFRPRVHDSDGLAILTGQGERIWRPLTNPRKLEVSAFVDNNVRGFGLMQRRRTFSDYQDLEARYERRPSVWVDFMDGVGEGNVFLVELPTEEEIHDNIVAFWRPSQHLEKGREHQLRYRLRWRDDTPTQYMGPWISDTRIGRAYFNVPAGSLRFVVDFLDRERFSEKDAPVAKASASSGLIRDVVSKANPETGGVRVSFIFEPKGKESAELRLNLGDWNGRTAETWLYRWSSGQ
jgi:glucans biosynthesis protein